MNEVSMWKKIRQFISGKSKSVAPKNGKWKEFNKHAILVSEGYYENDVKHGRWRLYYETGELLLEEHYNHGQLHGRYACYHTNGRVLSEGSYRHGKREGFFNVFDERGTQIKRLLFVDNVLLEDADPALDKIPEPVEG